MTSRYERISLRLNFQPKLIILSLINVIPIQTFYPVFDNWLGHDLTVLRIDKDYSLMVVVFAFI
jgi:hypothetical protein